MDASYPPAGLLYIAAAARDCGHEVQVIDGQIVGDEALLQEFSDKDFDYFGTTILTPLREASYEIIRKIKAIRPQCITIAGGAHVSILPEQTMRHEPQIDIVVVGEGEKTIVDILSGKPLEHIPGIWFREGEKLRHTPRRAQIDPAVLPMPAWDLIDITPYRAYEDVVIEGASYTDKPFLTIYSSRGCTGSCSFCSTWRIWREWRQVPVDRFINEIEYLHGRGIDHFFIADDSMINNEDFVESFANELTRRNIGIRFKIACRADKITQRVVLALKRSGCYEVHIGFESGSQRILDALGKKLTVEDNIRAAKLIREAGMRVYALMIIGSIQEDVNSINETIDFLNLIQPDVVASVGGLMLLPGTRDYHEAVRQGFLKNDYWQGKQLFPFYTKNFSQKELGLLNLAIQMRRKIWSRRLLRFQFLLQYPMKFERIMCGGAFTHQMSRFYARFRSFARHVWLKRRSS